MCSNRLLLTAIQQSKSDARSLSECHPSATSAADAEIEPIPSLKAASRMLTTTPTMVTAPGDNEHARRRKSLANALAASGLHREASAQVGSRLLRPAGPSNQDDNGWQLRPMQRYSAGVGGASATESRGRPTLGRVGRVSDGAIDIAKTG